VDPRKRGRTPWVLEPARPANFLHEPINFRVSCELGSDNLDLTGFAAEQYAIAVSDFFPGLVKKEAIAIASSKLELVYSPVSRSFRK
jgi:hypothetical protein